MNELAAIKDIEALEEALLELPQAKLETKHYFAYGTYTRELHLPKGTTLTGKIHRQSCVNILAKGKMLVVTNEGEYEIEAPYVFVSSAGIKKAGHVLEDSVWINVHPWTGPEDLEMIEHEIIAPSFKALT